MHPDLKISIKNQNNYDSHTIISVIIDSDYKIQAVSKYMLDGLNIDTDEIIGKSFIELKDATVTKLTGLIDDNDIQMVNSNYRKLNRIVEATINEKIIISCLDLTLHYEDINPYLNTFIPIFSSNEENMVIGVQMVSCISKLYGVNDYFKALYAKSSDSINPKQSLKLAPRQHEILYLLANGFSQADAAQILNISRGALANIISEQICPKFNITGSNTKTLVEQAKLLEIDKIMPKGLLRPNIIVFDQYIVDKYFAADY